MEENKLQASVARGCATERLLTISWIAKKYFAFHKDTTKDYSGYL